jgi:hypothetical protein
MFPVQIKYASPQIKKDIEDKEASRKKTPNKLQIRKAAKELKDFSVDARSIEKFKMEAACLSISEMELRKKELIDARIELENKT